MSKEFPNKFESGLTAEEIAGTTLAERFGYTYYPYHSPIHFDGFDYILRRKGSKTIFMENKNHERETGNLFLEIKCLTNTEADLWSNTVFYMGLIIVFNSKKMEDYCRDNNMRIVRGGENNGNEGYLVPIEELKELSWVKIIEIE